MRYTDKYGHMYGQTLSVVRTGRPSYKEGVRTDYEWPRQDRMRASRVRIAKMKSRKS